MGAQMKTEGYSSQWLKATHPRPAEGAGCLISRRTNDFLTKHVAGNKFGALLLTIFSLTDRRGDERFTIGLRLGAIQDGIGKIGEARLKHPTFNRIGASP